MKAIHGGGSSSFSWVLLATLSLGAGVWQGGRRNACGKTRMKSLVQADIVRAALRDHPDLPILWSRVGLLSALPFSTLSSYGLSLS
jgi:hypothetical protein